MIMYAKYVSDFLFSGKVQYKPTRDTETGDSAHYLPRLLGEARGTNKVKKCAVGKFIFGPG
jgi:hypothetical protein